MGKSKYIWDMIPGATVNEWESRQRRKGSQKAAAAAAAKAYKGLGDLRIWG